MDKRMHKIVKSQTEKGFTLIELLLVMAVIALVGVAASAILQDSAIRISNQRIAAQMLDVQQAAENYVVANFSDIVTINIPNTNDIGEIPLTTLKTDNFLTAGFSERNRFQQDITVYIRNLGANFTNGLTVEVLAISENPPADVAYIPDGRLRNIVRYGGAKLGYSSAIVTANEIASLSGQWSLDRAPYVAAGTSAPDAGEGGYLAAYGRISQAEALKSDVLYKIPIATAVDANVMQANLDMNNYNLTGAKAMTVDRLEVTGNTEILAEGFTDGTFANALNISQMAQFNNAVSVNHAVVGPDGSGCAFDGAGGVVGAGCDVVGGNMIVNYADAVNPAILVQNDVDFIDLTAVAPSYTGAVVAEDIIVEGAGNTAVTFTSAEFQDVVVSKAAPGADPSQFGKVTAFTMNMAGASGSQPINVDAGAFQMVGNGAATNTFETVNASGMVVLQAVIEDTNTDIEDLRVTRSLDVTGDMNVIGTTNVTKSMGVGNKVFCQTSGGDPC
jgi:prepilin-type N-terminal cleavage/methylation domain-containing protein